MPSARVLRVVGEHDAQFDGKARIAGIALGQGAHAGNGRRPCRWTCHRGSGSRPGRCRRPADGRHTAAGRCAWRRRALPCRASSPAWRNSSLCALVLAIASILAMLGSLGLTLRRRSSASSALSRADQLVIPGQAGQRFGILGVGEKNLLPDLDGHVGPSAGLQGTGFLDQDAARGIGRAGRLLLGKTHLQRQQQAARNDRTSFSKPCRQPSSALPFYFQFPARTKPESAVEKSSGEQGKILIVICQVLSIQSRRRIPLRAQANCLPRAKPAPDRGRPADKAARPPKIPQVHLAPMECPGHLPFQGGHHDWQDRRSWPGMALRMRLRVLPLPVQHARP